MSVQATSTEFKTFAKPDEVRTFEKGKIELIRIGNTDVGRMTLEPGWQWSKHVKPLVKTEWCQVAHFGYHISGRLHVRMVDGQEFEFGPGTMENVPPGHDAWVVGNEPVVLLDLEGAREYAVRKR